MSSASNLIADLAQAMASPIMNPKYAVPSLGELMPCAGHEFGIILKAIMPARRYEVICFVCSSVFRM